MYTIPIFSLGKTAKNVFGLTTELQIMGISSRGIFLKTDTRWVLFISSEKFRGPLTLNSSNNFHLTEKTQIGDPVYLSGKYIVFPSTDTQLDYTNAKVWSTEILQIPNQTNIKRTNEALATINDPLLNKIISSPQNTKSDVIPFEKHVLAIFGGLKHNDLEIIEKAIDNLLGRGTGLTPEGDDFLIGLVLSLYNQESNRVLPKKETFFAKLVKKAYDKTTQISANLLECAAMGQADERLTAVLYALKQTPHDCSEEIENLLTWGNTSGRMALIGIAVGLLSDKNLEKGKANTDHAV